MFTARLRVASASLACLAFSTTSPAHAQETLLYDNGAAAHGGWSEVVSYAVAADDFVLDPTNAWSAEIVGIRGEFWDSGNAWDGTVQWWILEDDARGRPGAVIASGPGANPKAEFETFLPGSPRVFTLEFGLGRGVVVSTGKRYWLALHLAPDLGMTRFVSWRGHETVKNKWSWRGGDLVDGVPDFSGPPARPTLHDQAFRLMGYWKGSGPVVDTGNRHLHGVLAEWCAVVHHATTADELVCDFPWDLTVDVDELPSDKPDGPSPKSARSAGAETRNAWRAKLGPELLQLFRRSTSQKAFVEALQRTAVAVEATATGTYFDAQAKSSLLASIRGARKPDLDLARALVVGLNAMELDARVRPTKPVHVAAGPASAADLGGVATVAFKGVEAPGRLALDVRKDVVLPPPLRGSIVSWPFCAYRFQFEGKLAPHGYVDLTFRTPELFAGRLAELRVIELGGGSFKDVTLGVDEKRGFVTARTGALSTYVLLAPPDPNPRADGAAKEGQRQ